MIKTVKLRGVELGAGKPKIAVSLTGETVGDVLAQAAALKGSGAEIAEWRMDWFADRGGSAALSGCLAALRDALGETPLLATFRTRREGGRREISTAEYLALNEAVIASGMADLLDVELYSGEGAVSRLISAAHGAGLPVVLSNHDFEKTPPKDEMVRRLCRMQELGADVLKLAVMPRAGADVLALLQATEEMRALHAARPLVTVSMGRLGLVSRLCGEVFGSAMTFGAVGRASAPGQLDAGELAHMLDLLSPQN